MINDIHGKITVPTHIKPVNRSARLKPELDICKDYYVSFGNNTAYPCTLLRIINEFSKTEVEIQVLCKSKKIVIDRNGNKSHVYTTKYIVYADEIGLTPEDAVKNCV